MAGDSALLAMSTSRRMPKPTSCTMVRSKPERPAGRPTASIGGSGHRSSGSR
jgi:hypothetical protein